VLTFPLIKGLETPVIPSQASCPLCGTRFNAETGLVYLSAGAILRDRERNASIETDLLCGFLELGVHGPSAQPKQSCHLQVADEVRGGQFDINVCSLDCLETLFKTIVDRMRAEMK
jgi:hypothetical protein